MSLFTSLLTSLFVYPEPKLEALTPPSPFSLLYLFFVSQVDRLGPCNLKLFDVVTQPEHLSEDFVERMLLLSCITNEGRSITFIQRDLGEWALCSTAPMSYRMSAPLKPWRYIRL